MTWVVLDTAMPLATVAVVQGARVLGAHTLFETKRHAESLVDALDRALLAAGVGIEELAGVAVGRGPGSFIGVRTGIAFAKGLALGRGIPVVGLPTLVALAAGEELPDGDGLVAIDAKRGEAYVQRVRARGGTVAALGDPEALATASLLTLVEDAAFVVGNAITGARERGGPQGAPPAGVRHAEGLSARGLALVLAARGEGLTDEGDALVPDYCRGADAKLPGVDPSARRDALLR